MSRGLADGNRFSIKFNSFGTSIYSKHFVAYTVSDGGTFEYPKVKKLDSNRGNETVSSIWKDSIAEVKKDEGIE